MKNKRYSFLWSIFLLLDNASFTVANNNIDTLTVSNVLQK